MNKKIIILGKGGGGGSIEGAVRYDEPQQLTDEQKRQAQENLGIDLSANLKREIVDVLPSEGEENIIYMVAKQASATGNVYDEYMYINGQWELIGSTEVDLSDYYKKGEVDAMVNAIPKHWFGTKEEYEAIVEKDENTIYHIEGGDSMWFGTQAQYDALTEKEKDVLYFIEGTGGDYYTKEETDTAIQGVKETLQGEIDGKVDNDTYEAKIGEIEGVLEGNVKVITLESASGWKEKEELNVIKDNPSDYLFNVYNSTVGRYILCSFQYYDEELKRYNYKGSSVYSTTSAAISVCYISLSITINGISIPTYSATLNYESTVPVSSTNKTNWNGKTTMAEVEAKGYLTEHQSLNNYYTKGEVDSKIPTETSELVFELADGTTKTINVVVKEG